MRNRAEMIAVLKDIKKNGLTVPNYKELENIIATLEAEQRNIENKSARKSDLAKAAGNVIKSAKKDMPWARMMHGAWIADGKQYVCDGHRAIEIFEPINLEPVKEEGKYFKVAPLFQNIPCDLETFELPTVPELKSMISEAKEEAKLNYKKYPKIVYCFENGPVVNAQFLMDAILATGGNECFTRKSNTGKYIDSLFFQSEKCNVLVLPIYPAKSPAVSGRCTAI